MLVRRDFVDVVLGARLRHVVPARDSIAPLGRLRVRGRAHRGQDGGGIPLPAQNGWPSGRARREGLGAQQGLSHAPACAESGSTQAGSPSGR